MKNVHAKIEFQNVSKTFIQKQTQRVHVLDDISMTVSENEFLVIVGPGQSGKSTLLRIAGGLEPPTTGRVTLDG
jgi:NitT/TauT family transport system ATP-binding protein/sulfonate transport system ATP-binding protein